VVGDSLRALGNGHERPAARRPASRSPLRARGCLTYWVMREYEADTPDTYGISFAAHPKYEDGNIRDLLSVEVTEYETHSDENVIVFVKRNLSNKYLPKHYILLVHVNKRAKR
jgi:hypothetical protein